MIFDGWISAESQNVVKICSQRSLNMSASSPEHQLFWMDDAKLREDVVVVLDIAALACDSNLEKLLSIAFLCSFINSTRLPQTMNGSGVLAGQTKLGGGSVPSLMRTLSLSLTWFSWRSAAIESSRISFRTEIVSAGKSLSFKNAAEKMWAVDVTARSELQNRDIIQEFSIH